MEEKVLVAPLGELPGEEELQRAWEWVLEKEDHYEARTLRRRALARKPPVSFLRNILEGVRGEEGILVTQETGGGVTRAYVKRYGPAELSALVVAGVHGERSVYVLRFSRAKTDWKGSPPDLTVEFRRELESFPEARAELEVLSRRLQGRLPGLARALEARKNPPLLVGAVVRGHVAFLTDPTNRVTHFLVGKVLASLNYPYWRGVEEAEEDFLVGFLRQTTPLRALPREALLALLRGEGGVEEAESLLVLAQLAGP